MNMNEPRSRPTHDQLFGIGEMGGNLLGQRLDARRDGFRRDQFVDDIWPLAHAYFSAPWVSPRTKYLPPRK